MQPLKNELHCADDVLFVFYDFENTQDTKINETAKLPVLICLQQFCTACEMQDDYKQDCAQCGKRRHSFFEDPVGDLLSYLCEPRPSCKKVVAIAHNTKAFESQFILNRAIYSSGPRIKIKRVKDCQYEDPSHPIFGFSILHAHAFA